jgi:beta-galactosidase
VHSMTDRSARRRLAVLAGILMLAMAGIAAAAVAPTAPLPKLEAVTDAGGSRLLVDGRDFMVLGMNWDYVPIGQNYNYSLWVQSDNVIADVLAREMPLLQAMGVNTIRQYVGVPPRWVQHIYEKYGIFTVLNHTVGRYGLTIDGAWLPNTDYSDPRVRSMLKSDLAALVDQYKDTPGVLMWLLGNENNYGLTWKSAETEALPEGERHAARAEYLYSLFGELIATSSSATRSTWWRSPTATCSTSTSSPSTAGHLDVMGSNVYRGDLGARLLPGGEGQAGRAGDVHRVRLGRLQRAGGTARTRPCRPATCWPSGRRSTSSRPARAGWATPPAA